MWAIIRLVVVLPLVPVTAMTGIFGTIVVGPAPFSASATCLAALSTISSTSVAGSSSSTSATARPSAWARSRCRQGYATTSVCASLVVRTRTASRLVPDSCAIARTSRASARAANRCRNPVPGSPGRAFLSPIRFANRFALSVGTSASPLMSRVSLIAALGKYRLGPSRTRSSTRDVTVGTLAERVTAGRRCVSVGFGGGAVRECWFQVLKPTLSHRRSAATTSETRANSWRQRSPNCGGGPS